MLPQILLTKRYLQSQKVTRSSDTALAGTLSNFRHLDQTMFYQAELEQKIDALTSVRPEKACVGGGESPPSLVASCARV